MKRYTKDSIDTRWDHWNTKIPCVNVKAHSFPSTWDVEKEFGCSEEVAQQALDYCFETHCEQFWEEVQTWVDEIFPGYGAKAWQQGRCGGYVVVEGLPDLSEWDAVMVAKWRKFEKWCETERDYLCMWETVRDTIDANRWAEEGARRFNFCDTKDGKTFCMADLYAKEKAAKESAREEFFSTL